MSLLFHCHFIYTRFSMKLSFYIENFGNNVFAFHESNDGCNKHAESWVFYFISLSELLRCVTYLV